MEEDPQMTEVHSNLSSAHETSSRPRMSVCPQVVGKTRRNNVQAIGAGMAFILSEQRNNHWSDYNLPGSADVLTTAYVLARLGEVPYDLLSDTMRVQVRKALDWLIAARSPNGGWGRTVGAACDADSTAWAVIALRRQGSRVSADDLEALRSCRSANGNFGAPDIAAVAANALAELDAECSDRLASWLLAQGPGSSDCRFCTPLYACSALLELGPVKVSRSLLENVRDVVGRYEAESVFEQALLLRCLLQLGLQKAWWVADDLRGTQMPDGSWPASSRPCSGALRSASALDENRIFTAMTAISALVMANSQPGLFFGSEGLLPRRLYGA
jgi:hypothetical protein